VKIAISYIPDEEQQKASATLATLQRLHPDAKVKRGDRHPPYKHIYLTVKNPIKPNSRACDE
jgi:hypothetical protein